VSQMQGAVRSKTVWLGLVISVAGYLQANVSLLKTLLRPVLEEDLVEPVMGAITMGLGLLVIVVRFLTDGPLSAKV